MPYLYTHTRLDKNEIFYIGISKSNVDYKRAYSIIDRNPIWIKIFNKTEYRVDILIESEDLSFIKNKEIELIAFYGRKDIGTGILSNMSRGGDGVHDVCNNGRDIPIIDIHTKCIYKSIKQAAEVYNINSGTLTDYLSYKKCTNPTTLIKLSDYEEGMLNTNLFKGRKRKKEVYDIKTKETYDSPEEVCTKTGMSIHVLYHKLTGSCINDTNYIYLKDFNEGLLPKNLKIDSKKKKVIDNITLNVYNSIKEASDSIPMQEKLLSRYLTGDRKNKTSLVYLSDYLLENPNFKH